MTLPELPTRRECPHLPPSGYDELRADGPLTRVRLPDGRPAWLVTGYAEARALLADPRLSSDRSHPDFPVPARPGGGRPRPAFLGTLIGTDPPAHDRQRRLLAARFTARRAAALRPWIRRVVDERIDRMTATGRSADLVADFALPVPSTVICGLLGVPYDDHAFFEEQARLRLDPEHGPDAMQRLTEYLTDLLRRKEKRPGDGLLDELLADGTVDRATVLSLALVLLVAGHGSSANMIALGALAALTRPDLAAALRDTRARPAATEELLRHLSVVTIAPRRATADITVAGRTVHIDDAVLVGLAAADHDPGYVEAPERLDPGRTVRGHLAFGHGIHQCLGQSLARVELDLAYEALFTRLPTLRLAVPVDRLPVRHGLLAELPVAW
ncbi:cytochrome P450 [Actinocatenispora rupis]|uniref:Cytochrome P450 n=1 Tax=Actinocatenispora rupis TaxID=519421 RepID=A0A8J3J984_9ACTN|nr:cytochrome P450 [Actinocatenispora rupis]GID12477.1 cytochrome P450 [Actinocatenispora rupis]